MNLPGWSFRFFDKAYVCLSKRGYTSVILPMDVILPMESFLTIGNDVSFYESRTKTYYTYRTHEEAMADHFLHLISRTPVGSTL